MNKEQVNLSYFAAHPEICHPQAEALQRSIAWETMENRGIQGFKQYGLYFAVMWIGGLKYPEHAKLIRSGNFYWRWVDDVADGDRQLPEEYTTREEFLQRRRNIVQQLFFQPESNIYGEREDILLADYYCVARRLGVDLRQESLAILDSIIWDEERARNRRVLTQDELIEGIDKSDLACISGGLKVAGESCTPYDLSTLSWAVRTRFNLRDFPKDFAQGMINISTEDVEEYGVDLTKVAGRSTVEQLVAYGPMRAWYKNQTAVGRNFLDEALITLDQLDLKWITRLVLNVNFIRPTQSTLNRFAKMLAV